MKKVTAFISSLVITGCTLVYPAGSSIKNISNAADGYSMDITVNMVQKENPLARISMASTSMATRTI